MDDFVSSWQAGCISVAGQRRGFKRMHNPQLNKREELEINSKSLEENQPFLTWEVHMTRPFFQSKSSPISAADTQCKIPDMCVCEGVVLRQCGLSFFPLLWPISL